MAKAKKTQAKVNATQERAKKGTMNYRLSEAREIELSKKIADGIEYYGRTFGKTLSPEDVVGIMLKVVERDKERLFINKISPISEADMLWYAEQNEVQVYDEQGEEGSGGDAGEDAEGVSSNGTGQASAQA